MCLQRDEAGEGQHYTQFGLVSWGEGCALPGSPGFYAYLPHFRAWLHDVAIPTLGELSYPELNSLGHFIASRYA